jgi:hypothetical protein
MFRRISEMILRILYKWYNSINNVLTFFCITHNLELGALYRHRFWYF